MTIIFSVVRNFGAIRNVESLNWERPAPIFDSGTSLWHNEPDLGIGSPKSETSKPFREFHRQQIQLVASFDWLDVSKLKGLEDELNGILKQNAYIPESWF